MLLGALSRSVLGSSALSSLKTKALIRALDVPDPPNSCIGVPTRGFNKEAAEALIQRGPVVIPDLIEALKYGTDDDIRLGAINVLKAFGPRSEKASASLVRLLGQSGMDLKTDAEKTLIAIGPSSLPGFFSVIRSKGERDFHIIFAAAKLGPRAVPALVRALEDTEEDGHFRDSVVRILGRIKPVQPEGVSALIRVVEKALPGMGDRFPSWGVDAAIDSLGEMGPKARSAVPILLEAMARPTLARDCARSLSLIGEGLGLAADVLLEELDKRDSPYSRKRAAESLGRIGERDPRAIPALVKAFETESEFEVRTELAEALGVIGPAAKAAVPALLRASLEGDQQPVGSKAVGDQVTDRDLVHASRLALYRIASASEEDLDVLIGMLSHKEPIVRHHAAGILGMVGSKARRAAPVLLRQLRGPDSADRSDAAQALGRIGADDRQVIAALRESLRDKDDWVRLRSCEALTRLHAEKSLVIEVYARLLADERGNIRVMIGAADGLAGLGAAEPRAIPFLINALETLDTSGAMDAARILGLYGDKAAQAVPALARTLVVEGSLVEQEARKSLKSIGTPEARKALLIAPGESL